MVRRTFRLGFWAGLLVGAALAVYKTMESRRAVRESVSPSERDPWPPISRVEPVDERPTAAPVPRAEPEPGPGPQAAAEAEEGAKGGADEAEDEAEGGGNQEAAAMPHLEIVPAPTAALEERTAPAPAAMVAPEPADVAIPEPPAPSGLRLVRPPAEGVAPKWVEPVSPDVCPSSHPIKVKLSSKLFHLPGMLAYTRTKPDRCYGTEESAVEDGFTRAKR
jgi:hypothetical protein